MIATEPAPDSALLVEDATPGLGRFSVAPTAGHPASCLCCAPRGAVGEALNRLFQARARGEIPFFRSVTAMPATAEGEAAIRAALATDPLVTARFRAGSAASERP